MSLPTQGAHLSGPVDSRPQFKQPSIGPPELFGPQFRQNSFQTSSPTAKNSQALPSRVSEPRQKLGSSETQGAVRVKELWKKLCENEDNFRKNMCNLVTEKLYPEIREALKVAVGDGEKQLSKTILEIKAFLGDDKTYKIDDCIRWPILYKAVDQTTIAVGENGEEEEEPLDSEKSLGFRITQIIIDLAAHLAFDNPYNDSILLNTWKGSTIRKRCKHQELHAKHKMKWKTTPFHKAAATGNDMAIKYMIEQAELLVVEKSRRPLSRDLFLKVLQSQNPDSLSTHRALEFAAADSSLKTLKTLLSFDPAIAFSPDTTFKSALANKQSDIINTFLQFEKLREVFVTEQYILQAMDLLGKTESTDSERQQREGVVNTLINRADTGEVITEKVVRRIIELNLKEIWEKKISKLGLKTSGLLHLAVTHQNAEFVEIFIHDYPDQVIEKKENFYALWHNNKVRRDGGWVAREFKENDPLAIPNHKIRDMLVTAIIKNKNDKMQDLVQRFEHSGQIVNELCFDLSRFNSKVYPVSDFVRSLVNHEDNADLLSYEHTIKYAEFPALDLKADEKEIFGDGINAEHTEVFGVLDWLRRKRVDEIIELTVPDRLVNPHNEIRVGKCARDFKVEILNWRFLDMSISIFKDPHPDPNDPDPQRYLKRIRELHLYASGKEAVISHWLSQDGIRSLPNLTTLEIYVIQELMTKDNCREIVESMRQRFKILENEINEERKRKHQELEAQQGSKEPEELKILKVNINAQLWNPTVERLADLEEIAERVVPKLSRFIKSYHDYVHNMPTQGLGRFRPTKVAIIDNGILSISPRADGPWDLHDSRHLLDRRPGSSTLEQPHTPGTGSDKFYILKDDKSYKTLWSRIKGGRSFVDDNSRVSPWLFASDPHGTQMANLICALDPWCELYVAKVSEGRSGIIGTRVAQAINWARLKGVDVISMSFAILDDPKELVDACDDAAKAGIVMLCSSHDAGSNIEKAYPADCDKTITINACDEFGEPLRPTIQRINHSIRGREVPVGRVPFLESDDSITGSSVSTAIAAGLSSLVLSCDRLAFPGKVYSGQDRSNVVNHHLKKMRPDPAKEYIMLDKFAEIDVKNKDGKDINVQDRLDSYFKLAVYKK